MALYYFETAKVKIYSKIFVSSTVLYNYYNDRKWKINQKCRFL